MAHGDISQDKTVEGIKPKSNLPSQFHVLLLKLTEYMYVCMGVGPFTRV